jgi:hypothetical protein
MNFYFQAASVLDNVDAKKGSVKGLLAALPEKDRKRTAALVIETLKCTQRTPARASFKTESAVPYHRQARLGRRYRRRTVAQAREEACLKEPRPRPRP